MPVVPVPSVARRPAALLAAGVALLGLAGCGDHGDDRIPAAASLVEMDIATTTSITVAGGPTAPGAVGTVPDDAHAVGEAVVTASGNTITLHGLRPEVDVAGRYHVDVEACAGPAAARLETSLFNIELADGTLLQPTTGGPEPALATTDLPPGTCKRGWVTFPLAASQTPLSVVFRGSSIIRWGLT